VAPDAFKGTYTAGEVAAALAKGLREGGADPVLRPIGDGGEGTLEALLSAWPGEFRTAPASDPLGRTIEARYVLLDDGATAIVEAAEASGLTLVAEDERDAWRASTRGTGELIVAAVRAGARRVIVTVGGSATTDGGAGALAALADAFGGSAPIIDGGAGVLAALAGLPELIVLCDVATPWERAPSVFGPQKGADPATVTKLEQRMAGLAALAPRDPRGVPHTGAAGGLAGGLWAYCNAELVPGAEFVLDAIGFDALAAAADLVVTGEGALDEQTFAGKAVGVVAQRSARAGTPCIAVVGTTRLDDVRARELGLAAVEEATNTTELRAAGRRLAGRWLDRDGRRGSA
jgi:glycerate kinase